ncbi:MAG: hypothetical protein AAGF24_08180, partial [Cyanobacteria bacterium P01_H01_bin.121]
HNTSIPTGQSLERLVETKNPPAPKCKVDNKARLIQLEGLLGGAIRDRELLELIASVPLDVFSDVAEEFERQRQNLEIHNPLGWLKVGFREHFRRSAAPPPPQHPQQARIYTAASDGSAVLVEGPCPSSSAALRTFSSDTPAQTGAVPILPLPEVPLCTELTPSPSRIAAITAARERLVNLGHLKPRSAFS